MLSFKADEALSYGNTGCCSVLV